MNSPFVFIPLLVLVSIIPAGASVPVVVSSRSIASPVASDTVWITANVTSTNNLASVNLSYTASIPSGTASAVFTETFGKTAVKPWVSTSPGTDTAPANPRATVESFDVLPPD